MGVAGAGGGRGCKGKEGDENGVELHVGGGFWWSGRLLFERD